MHNDAEALRNVRRFVWLALIGTLFAFVQTRANYALGPRIGVLRILVRHGASAAGHLDGHAE